MGRTKKSRIANNTTKDKDMDMFIDRISHLPDSILGHILSFLPTQNAVATSILSKRWKFTWFMVHNLDFSCVNDEPAEGRQGADKNLEFVRFVERVLLLHDGGSINKFSLSWASYNTSLHDLSSNVISWINFALTRNVRTLYLSLDCDGMIDLPISGFSCDTLRSLELNEINLVCDATAASVCLPRLESLKLDHVYCASREACEKLISGCPVLQELYVYIYNIDASDDEGWGMISNVFSCESLQSLEFHNYLSVPSTIVISCTRLETLKLECVSFQSKEACEKLINGCPMLRYLYLSICSTSYGDDDDDMFTCIISSASLRHLNIDFREKSSLKLNACSLESFEVSGDISEISVEKNLRSLVKADFRISLVEHDSVSNSNNSIVEAVRAFDCARFLTLSPSVMSALSHATISISTEFKQLVYLAVEAFCSSIDVIQNSNNLQHLTIYQQQSCRHDHPRWTTPVEVPRCLSNSLQSVYFHGYNGSECEREMIRYILKHGSSLKVMRISCHYSKEDAQKLKLVREICVFPRKSTDCQVHFSE